MITTGTKMDAALAQGGMPVTGPSKKSADDGFLSILESMFGSISTGNAPTASLTCPGKNEDDHSVLSTLGKSGQALSKLGAEMKGLPFEIGKTPNMVKDAKSALAASGTIQDALSGSSNILKHTGSSKIKNAQMNLTSFSKKTDAGNLNHINKQKLDSANPVEVEQAVMGIPEVTSLGANPLHNTAAKISVAGSSLIPHEEPKAVTDVRKDINPGQSGSILVHSFMSATDTVKQPILSNSAQVIQHLVPQNAVQSPLIFVEHMGNALEKDMSSTDTGESGNSKLDQLVNSQAISPNSVSVLPVSSLVHSLSETKTHMSPQTLDLTHSAWTEQVARLVNHAEIRTDESVQVKVHPEGMGDLLISVSHTSSGVQIQMESNQMATAQWLGQQTQQMVNAVNQLGINVAGVEVSFGQANLSNSGYGHQSKKSNNENESLSFASGEVTSIPSLTGVNAMTNADSGFRSGSSVSFRA